ncbi:MAG: hypothetical protein WCF94_02805 [bacterium]|jgi:hypothetical protein
MKKKKVVICASASFEKEIVEWKNKLESLGYDVIKYPEKIGEDNFLEDYKLVHVNHYNSIVNSNMILALNLEKKGITGYIGAGVFAEIAFAIGLNKTLNKNIEVCYLNTIPNEVLPYSDELKLWQDLGWIKQFKA